LAPVVHTRYSVRKRLTADRRAVVAAPWRESDALRVARALEQAGATNAKPA
jgi:SH3-like domain-containing protein